MNMLEMVGTTLTITTILLGVFYTLLKKWFLDLETYNHDKDSVREKEREELNHLEVKLVEEFKTLLLDMQREKANADDLAKAEKKMEKMDYQIASIMQTVEKQSYRLELLIDNRQELPNQIKDLKTEVTSQLKDIKADIARQENKIVTMQLDVQDLKSRLT